jgi:2-oxoglutarate dehydrogenase E2 component (dihydrolipoamide succinyltransferase)
MSVSVTMPRLGESVSEGTVTRWLKKEGERVEADEPLLEVSTDKVDTEIPAPASGVLESIKVAEDETVEVGVELAVISDSAEGGGAGAATEEAPAEAQPAAEEAAPPQQREEVAEPEAPAEPEPTRAPAAAPPAAAEPEQPPAQAPAAAEPSGDGGAGDASYVTPLVRRLAAEQGVDLAQVAGTGVGGRIRKQDVLDAARAAGARAPDAATPSPAAVTAAPAAPRASAPAPPSAPSPATAAVMQARGRTEKLSRLRAVIASRMVESLQVSAQLTTVLEVDVTRVATLRQRAKSSFEAREGVKLSFLPFFAVATCEALKAHPALNASIDVDKGEVTYHDAEHLGIAVDTERGLLVPVIRDAGDLNLGGMARKIADLAERTRSGKVTPDELGGGTFTLTNTGSRGALFDTPIINQPQVGILGTGAVVKRAVVIDDPNLGESLAIRSMVYLALTYDHRLVDGADAARFLVTVKERLEEGAFEADLGL